MKIDLIDNSGVLHLLEFEFQKKGIQIDTNKIISTLHTTIQKVFTKIDYLFEDLLTVKLKVNLEQRNHSHKSVALARIDTFLSSKEQFVFYIYYETLIEVVQSSHAISKTTFDFVNFENTILHELIHASDLYTLKKIDNILDKEARLSKMNNGFNSIQIIDARKEEISYDPLHWHFLYTINRFRNEGVAVLGEKLFGVIIEREYPKNQNEILDYIQNLLSNIQTITTENIFSTNSNTEAYEDLTEFSLQAYVIGDFLLLKLIGKTHLELADLTEKAINYLLLGDEYKPTNEESKILMKVAFQFDLSDYISALISCHFDEINQTILLKEYLFEYCALIQDELNSEGLHSFSKSISIAAHTHSVEKFIALMEETVYTRMGKEEIIKGYNQFNLKKSDENIVNSIKLQAELLYKKAINEENEIAQWALTYLLDDEDLVFDKMTILGWQDDWLVLDAAIRIIYQ